MKNLYTTLAILLVLLTATNISAQELISNELISPTEHALHGYATAISGNWAIATSPQKDVDGKQSIGGATFYQKTNDGWVISQEVLPTDAIPLSNFGMSVAMSEETAVIGAIGDSESGLFAGAVYVYTYQDTAWVQTDKLTASDAGVGHRFGHSVAISDNIIVVGAYQATGNEVKSGAAYVYEMGESKWEQTTKLYANNGASHDYFGYSLELFDSINSQIVAIGAYNATGAAERSGAVFIYSKNNDEWNQDAKLFDLTGTSSDLFGYSIAFGCPSLILFKANHSNNYCDGNIDQKLFIGAPGTNNENGQTGSVYHFNNIQDGFSNMMKLEEQESANKDHFGTGMTYMNNELFVSAIRTNTTEASHVGSVYSFSYIDIEPVNLKTLSPVDDAAYSYFGSSISSSIPNMIISAPYETVDGLENAGAVYFYNYPLISNEEETVDVIDYKLEQNYPNPFNPTTTLNYQVKKAGIVKLTIFNVLGQEVQVLVNEQKSIGAHTAIFNASALSSGFYFYQLEVNDFTSTKKMLLIK